VGRAESTDMQRESHRVPRSHAGRVRAGFALKPALFLLLLGLPVVVALACSTGGTQSSELTGTVAQAVGSGSAAFTATPPAPIATSGGATVYRTGWYPGTYPGCQSTNNLAAAYCSFQYYSTHLSHGQWSAFFASDTEVLNYGFTHPCSYYNTTPPTQYAMITWDNSTDSLLTAACTQDGPVTPPPSNCSTGYIDATNTCVAMPGLATNTVAMVHPGNGKPGDPTMNGGTCDQRDQPGMCVPNASLLSASLQLNDMPFVYKPQKGPDVRIRLAYNHADAQPTVQPLGPRWTHNFREYIQDTPGSLQTPVTRFVAGGGEVDYNSEAVGGFHYSTSSYGPEVQGGAVLSYTGSISSYVLTFPDGTVKTFGQSDGSSSFPRNWFLTKITDPQGNYVTVAYDSSNRLTTITDAESRVTTFCYDPTRSACSTYSGSSKLISQITDPFGRTAVFSYDSYGRLSSIQDALGITSSFTWDGNPGADGGPDGGADPGDPYFISALTTPYGTSTFTGGVDYSADSRWLELTDPDGKTERVEYNETNSAISATESSTPSGMTVENGSYNLRNSFHWSKYACSLGYCDGGTKDFSKATITHWAIGQDGLPSPIIASTKQPLENREYRTYPGQNTSAPELVGSYDQPAAIGRVLDPAGDGGAGTSQVSTFTYNTQGHITDAVDPKGRETKYTYASSGAGTNIDLTKVEQVTASGPTYSTIAQYAYTDSVITTTLHKPLSYTDAANKVWLSCYNSAGQLTQFIDPANYVSGSACGSYGSVGTRPSYDGTGRVTSITDAAGNTQVTYAYSGTCGGGSHINCDLPSTVTDSTGWTLTYARDALDRVTSITYPDVSSTTDLYDYTFQSGTYSGTPSLDLRKYTDRLGRVTKRDYDAERRLTQVTDPLTNTVQYTHFDDGSLNTMTNQLGNVTTWTIDVQSRPTSKTVNGNTAGYTYESTTSRLHVYTDEYSNTKTYAYDAANDLTGITYTAGDTPNVTFSYGTYFPRMEGMTDGNGSSTFTYVAIGTNGALSLLKEDGPFTHDDVTYAYDVDGRENSRTVGETTAETWTRDALGRPATHTTDLGTFTYSSYLDETGLPGSRSLGGSSVTTTWGYGTTSNPMQLVSIGGAASQVRGYGLSFAITGTSEKNPYTVTANQEAAGAVSGHPWSPNDWSYTYDSLDRLTGASLPCSGGDAGSCLVPTAESFAYDAEGNPTTYSNASFTGGTLGYYGNSDWLQNSPPNTGYGHAWYNTGEYKESSTTRYQTWTGENQPDTLYYWNNYPTSYVQTQYWYDAEGRRVKQNYYDGVTSTDTYTTWCRGHVCARRDGSNNTKARYFPEGQANYSTGGTVTSKWLTFKDESGNVRDITDTSGNLVGAADYTPFGSILRTTGSLPDYLFGGMMWDANMQYSLSETRIYDPSMGRWWQPDPLGYASGVDVYAYVGGNPVSRIDPGGLQAEPVPELPQVPESEGPYRFRDMDPNSGANSNMTPYMERQNQIASTLAGLGDQLNQMQQLADKPDIALPPEAYLPQYMRETTRNMKWLDEQAVVTNWRDRNTNPSECTFENQKGENWSGAWVGQSTMVPYHDKGSLPLPSSGLFSN
jgi:RHS repeat-associated protein